MGEAGDVRAGGAYVEIGGRDQDLNRVLKRARERVKRFASDVGQLGRRLVMAGTVVAAPLALSVRKFASYGDQVAKMARRTGFSTEAVSRLGYAAQISGTSIEALEIGLKKMSRTIFDASIGLAESKRTLDILGISLDEIAAKSPEQQFMMMAEAIKNIDDPSKKAALAMTAMGKSGTMLIPLLDLGAEGIEKLGKNAENLGIVLGLKTAGGAEELTDAITDLKYGFLGLQLQIAQALLPTVMEWIGKIQESISELVKWVKLHKDSVVWVAKLAVKLLAVGVALIAVSGLMKAFMLFFTPGGAVMVAVASVLLLADAFGVYETGISNVIGSTKVFGRSIHDWTTFAGMSWLKLYEKVDFVATGMLELWQPLVERMKGSWRGLSVFIADTFLWAVENVINGLDSLVKSVRLSRVKLQYHLGLVSKTLYDIEVARAEHSMFPGTKKWLRETRSGLEEYSKELSRRTREDTSAADAAWNESYDKRKAKLKETLVTLEIAQSKLFDDLDEEDAMRAAARKKRAREQREEIDKLRKKMAELELAPGKLPGVPEKPDVQVARREVLGTMRGWRAAGVAAGGGQREVVTRLRSIDKAVTKTAIHIINMTGRYGGT